MLGAIHSSHIDIRPVQKTSTIRASSGFSRGIPGNLFLAAPAMRVNAVNELSNLDPYLHRARHVARGLSRRDALGLGGAAACFAGTDQRASSFFSRTTISRSSNRSSCLPLTAYCLMLSNVRH